MKLRPRSGFVWSTPSSPAETRSPLSRMPFPLDGIQQSYGQTLDKRALLSARPSLAIIRCSIAQANRSVERFTPLLPLPPPMSIPNLRVSPPPHTAHGTGSLPQECNLDQTRRPNNPEDDFELPVTRSFLATMASRKRPESSVYSRDVSGNGKELV